MVLSPGSLSFVEFNHVWAIFPEYNFWGKLATFINVKMVSWLFTVLGVDSVCGPPQQLCFALSSLLLQLNWT